jgi:predicted GIY-YIG superfamily endonuclease
MINDAITFLPHKCTSGCQAKVVENGEVKFKCRKLNNLKVSKDNTRHTFQSLPNEIPEECIQKLIQVGIVEPIQFLENGYRYPFKSKLPIFHPKRHIPPTNPNGDLNISPVEGYTFANCKSMQNIQVLTQSGGVNKYVCKYIAKLDEQNYVVMKTDSYKNGCLIKKSVFLHNTKVSTTKINEESERNASKDAKLPQGRCISHLEMIHQLLKYPEVVTNLRFVTIQTVPLEMRSGVAIEREADAEDGSHIGSISDDIRRNLELEEWRQHKNNEIMIIHDLRRSNVSLDKVSIFSIRPPELRQLFNRIGFYFRWFQVSNKTLKGERIMEMIGEDLERSSWIDGLQHQVLVRRKALGEILDYCNSLEQGGQDNPPSLMIEIFRSIHQELSSDHVLDEGFQEYVFKNLLDADLGFEHLPCPVYSYVKPTMGFSFLNHILLSMGQFETEIDLKMHHSIRDSFRYAKLIGHENDEESLQRYSDELLEKWIVSQMQYFPNALRTLASWVVVAGNLFDQVIVKDELPISEMPPVQLSTLFGNNEDAIKDHIKERKEVLINAIVEEIGQTTIERCQVPCIEQLKLATKSSPVQWNASECLRRNGNQSLESFEEQTFTIKTCTKAIDKYIDLWEQKSYTKNIGIRGVPGGGKTWCAMYSTLYALAKGLNVMTTAILAKRAIQLGGCHYHKLFCLPIGRNLSTHRKAELAILKLFKNPKELNTLLCLDVLVCDEMGQLSAEFLATIDIILRRIRDTNVYLGGLLIIGTIDHTQIQPIEGRPFLTSTHVVSCFRMVALKSSVRASTDIPFQRIQEIARYSHRRLKGNPSLIDEMINLCSEHFTFARDWNDPRINPQTMRLYSKKIPQKEAAKDFASRVRAHISPNNLRERKSEDVEKPRYSQLEWSPARESIVASLEQMLKEPRRILFFAGAIFECTYNDSQGKFSQSQMALLIELPTTNALQHWEKIKVLIAPPGMKEIDFNVTYSREVYLERGFREVKVGIAPERTNSVRNDMFARRKQYGLRHHVSMTIHAAMGDTLLNMATSISARDTNFTMWDKGQLIVILSRTKEAKKSIFVGPKEDTLAAFRSLVCKQTQWSDHMEQVLEIITLNSSEVDGEERRVLTNASFPYLIRDIVLPQCNTGFVYMLLSIRMRNFTYIGTTNCLKTRLKAHNSGHGALSTEPTYLRPYALFAYICGFGGGRSDLRYHIEKKWKEKRDELIRNGETDIKELAMGGNDVLQRLQESQFGVAPTELTLVCLFK